MHSQGHCVVITGGTRGIGAAIGRKFLKSGNQVILIARSDSRERQQMGGHFIACDLLRPEARGKLAETLATDYPNINVLINNAGMQLNGLFHEQFNYRSYAHELELNIHAVVDLTDRLLPVLKANARASAIVNVSSSFAIQPQHTSPIYSASKAFMHHFSTSLRAQLAQDKIYVMDLLPSNIDTEMTRGRGGGKISPAQLADKFWHGWLTNQETVYAGSSRLIYLLNRVSPHLAQRMVRAI